MKIKNRLSLYIAISLSLLMLLFFVKGEGNITNLDDSWLEEIHSQIENNDIIESNPNIVSEETNQVVVNETNDIEEYNTLTDVTNESSENETVISNVENDSITKQNTDKIYSLNSDIVNCTNLNDSDMYYNICQNNTTNPEGNATEQMLNRSLEIESILYPGREMYAQNITFNFFVNTSNVLDFNCSFYIYNQTDKIYEGFFNSNHISVNNTLKDGNYSWNIKCFDSLNSSLNDSVEGNFNVYIEPKILFWASKNVSYIGEEVNFNVNALLKEYSAVTVYINYSDGRSPTIHSNPTLTFTYSNSFTTTFSNTGVYKIGLTLNSGGRNYYRNISINVISNASNVTNNTSQSDSIVDEEDPKIYMMYPLDEAMLNNTKIDFVFRPKDNVKLSNCTYSLYYYNGSSSIGGLEYTQTINNPSNNESINITLSDFEEGDYSWDVECFDNSSNSGMAGRDFSFESGELATTVSLRNVSSNYESDIDEADRLIAMINEFMINEEKYDVETKEVVEFLNLLDKSRTYKKRLLQIKSDLSDNLGYSRDPSYKESRLNDIRNEIKDIKNNAIYSVNVNKYETYSKNSISSDMSEVIKSYIEKNNIFMSTRELSKLVDSVNKAQGDISFETHIKWVEFEYLNESTNKYSLVHKDIKGENNFEGVIEVIPKSAVENVNEIEFIENFEIIKEDPIVFFDSNVLEGKMTYMINSWVDFKELKDIDSIGFNLGDVGSNSKSAITGYAVLLYPENKGFWFYFSWIIFLIIISVLIYNIIIAGRVRGLKKDENFKKLGILIKNVKSSLEDKNIPKSKEIYFEIKKVYSDSEDNIKRHYYNDIIKIQLLIDRKDISALIKECINALNQKRNSDAALIYSKIKPIYKRLPEDLRMKVYEKIIPFLK